MEAISVNAPARHVRERLPSKDSKQADVDWSAFEHTVKYLYETNQASLAPDITWNQLSSIDKERAIDKVCRELEPLQLGWGDLMRPVVKWRLYHCHRKNRIKVMKAKGATEGASTSTPGNGTGGGEGTAGPQKRV